MNYATLVATLAKPGKDIIASLTPEKAHLLHMAVGISGEAGELLIAIKNYVIHAQPLDLPNVIEELGDQEFYMEGMRQGAGIERAEILPHERPSPYGRPTILDHAIENACEASELLDLIKKHVIYNRALDRDAVTNKLKSMDLHMDGLHRRFHVTRDETLLANTAKLSQRYKGHTYSDSAAQARADKASDTDFNLINHDNV